TLEQNQEGEWVQVNYIKSPYPIAKAAFGLSMSSDGYTVAVGAPYGDEAVYLYDVGDPIPSLPTRLALSSPGSGFGFSVSMWNDELAVGAPLGDTGSAYVFLRDSGEWVQQSTILA